MKKSHFIFKRNLFFSVIGGFSLALGVLVLCAGIILICFSLWADEKTVDASLLPEGKNVPVFFDSDGNEIEYISDSYLSPDEVPENLKKAFVALEDKRFYSHDGIDTYRILGATVENVKQGKLVEGASTITQQLVKNTHLTAEKSFKRKINEMAIAMKIEEEYSKDEILSMYLSVIYFGSGAYGVKDASRLYFGCTPDALTLSQCATLAGIVKNPKKYSPLNSIENAEKRRNLVLSVMLNEGYISSEEYDDALGEKIVVNKSQSANHDFYIDRVIEEITGNLGITRYQLDNSGYKIYTNMDRKLQSALEKESVNALNFKSENTENESIIIDNIENKVVAHFSSAGYPVSRQAGSTLKPLVVYAPALQENLITLATPLLDEKTTFGDWTPQNYENVYYGDVTPRDAIKKSINTVAVKIGSYLGENKMLYYGKKFGLSLSDADENLTLALGATKKGNTTIEIATAYSALANGGTFSSPSYVDYVTLNDKKVYSNTVKFSKVIDENTAYLLTDCLIDTVKDGTAKTLSVLPYMIAAKTGTTDNDAWCASYTSRHTLVVWHGGDETGGGHPTMHAKRVYQKIYSNYYPANFKAPTTVKTENVDLYSTLKNKSVTLANDCTPPKFVKSELFKIDDDLSSNHSKFESASVDFSVSVANGKAIIEFSPESVYDYELSRVDALGEKIVFTLPADLSAYSEDGKLKNRENSSVYCDGVLITYTDNRIFVTVVDNPLSIGAPVKYALKATIKNKNSQNIVLGTVEKSVFVN